MANERPESSAGADLPQGQFRRRLDRVWIPGHRHERRAVAAERDGQNRTFVVAQFRDHRTSWRHPTTRHRWRHGRPRAASHPGKRPRSRRWSTRPGRWRRASRSADPTARPCRHRCRLRADDHLVKRHFPRSNLYLLLMVRSSRGRVTPNMYRHSKVRRSASPCFGRCFSSSSRARPTCPDSQAWNATPISAAYKFALSVDALSSARRHCQVDTTNPIKIALARPSQRAWRAPACAHTIARHVQTASQAWRRSARRPASDRGRPPPLRPTRSGAEGLC